VPASIKLQQEYGDDLAVVFVESQGASPADAERFIMDRGWFGTQAMWTSERPFSTGSRGLPNFALLSADGELLLKGSYVNKAAKTLIEEEIRSAGGAPEGTPKKLQKAWKLFAKGDVAKAIASARKAGSKPELAEDAGQLVQEFERRAGRSLDRITWLRDNGYASLAKKQLKDISKQLKGADELFALAEEIEASFEEEEIERELEASEALEKALGRLYEDAGNPRLFDKIAKLADEYEGTKVAERARHIVSLAS
jgi:hypothetical protein